MLNSNMWIGVYVGLSKVQLSGWAKMSKIQCNLLSEYLSLSHRLKGRHTMRLVPVTSPCNKSQGLVTSCVNWPFLPKV